MQTIDQLSVFLENKPGHLARMARSLADAGINMRALMIADTAEFGVARIICDQPHVAKQRLEAEGYGVSLTSVIAVEIPDRPGGLADVLETLGAASVNVEYAYAFVEPGVDAAVDVLKVDGQRAAEVLEAAGIRILGADKLYMPDA